MIMLVFQQSFTETYDTNIEIFDIKQGIVIESLSNNEFIQAEIIAYLDNITDIDKKLNPLPNEGLLVRIPLEPSYTLHNEWVFSLIDEVLIIFQLTEDPVLLLFDEDMKAYFFHFHGDTYHLLVHLDIIKDGFTFK